MPHSCSLAQPLGQPAREALRQEDPPRVPAQARSRGGPGWPWSGWQGRVAGPLVLPPHLFPPVLFKGKNRKADQRVGGRGARGVAGDRTRSEDFQWRVTARQAGPLGAGARGPGGTGGRKAGCRLHWPQVLIWARPRFPA